MRLSRALAAALALGLLAVPGMSAADAPAGEDSARSELVGAFVVGAPITGATLLDGYLYVTSSDRLSIYDVSEPLLPKLVGTEPSPNAIYGELISTDGETLLLNNGIATGTLDIWNVEDKTNPVHVSSVGGVNDEHVSCALECTWAYGSLGSIVDLRKPGDPELRDPNWKEITGLEKDAIHRLDEFRYGFMATAPRQGPPVLLDVRRPLRPRIVARTLVPRKVPNAFLFSNWLRAGTDRYMVSSSETAVCNDKHQGALVTFDTTGWPRDRRFEVADTFKYRARTDSDEDEESCRSYYFSMHPDFADGGLILLPNGLEGTRIVEVSPRGSMEETDSFIPPVSDVWLAFWIDEEIFYALNTTGEVYILRYA